MRIFLIPLILIIVFPVPAQENSQKAEEQFNEIYSYTKGKNGIDQQLLSGYYHEYKYKHAEGHPFLFDNKFSTNDILFHNEEYKGVYTKYDIYEQALILKSSQGNSEVTIVLPNEFLSGFTIDERQFRKFTFPDQQPAFYQVVAETEAISCLYFWYKTRQESHHNVTFSSYKFTNSRHKSYLLINKQLLRYKSKKSFIQLYPNAIHEELAAYLKSHKFRLKKASDKEMSGLLQYSHVLLNQHHIQY